MKEDIMLTKLTACAGCGAKVGAGMLAKLLQDLPVHQDPRLIVGFDRSDDASVYQLTDELAIIQTVDFFPPIVDDPFTFGQIAAANALSDIYAMGGEPRLAQNLLCVPENMPHEAIRAILRGGYDKVYEAGAIITGGHSILDPEPKYGLCVTGFGHPKRILTNSGARAGDVLFLTKPLGVGILTTGSKAGLVSHEAATQAAMLMATLNKGAAECLGHCRTHACTDVTGFGFLGHLYEMAAGSGLSAHVDAKAVPFLPQAEELAKTGVLPSAMYRNRAFAGAAVAAGAAPLWLQDIFFSPETSGGLLIAVDPLDAAVMRDALTSAAPIAAIVGCLMPQGAGPRITLC